NTDYTVDYLNGVLAAKSGGALTVGEALTVTLEYADPSKVTDTDIIGAVSGGVYSGIQAFQTAYSLMGFFPKILIAPGFSQNADVASALDSLARKIRAIALVDSAPSVPVATAIADRGASGQAFDPSITLTVLCY